MSTETEIALAEAAQQADKAMAAQKNYYECLFAVQNGEIERLTAFAGNEIYRSDYQNVGQMRVEIERLKEQFPCGHRVIDWDNGYGDCVACRIKAQADDYEKLPLTLVEAHDEIERLKADIARIS